MTACYADHAPLGQMAVKEKPAMMELLDGSPEFLNAWRAWQEYHGRRYRAFRAIARLNALMRLSCSLAENWLRCSPRMSASFEAACFVCALFFGMPLA